MRRKFDDGLIVLSGRSTMKAWQRGRLQKILDSLSFTGRSARETHMLARLIAQQEGHLLFTSSVKNLVVTSGIGLIADNFIDVQDLGLLIHSIGTGDTAPKASDTQLETEVARADLAFRSRSGGVITVSSFYLASDSSYIINECGIWGGDAATTTLNSGVLFSRYIQYYDNSGGDVDLTFDYEVEIGRG